MTRILLAPNALKGSLTAEQAGAAMQVGIEEACADCEVVIRPVADGGDGYASIIAKLPGNETISVEAHDPLGRPIEAEFSYNASQGTAMIDVASVCGLRLLADNERNPLKTSSYGVGELIAQLLDLNVQHLMIGIGGTATNDAGIGMVAALGARFLDMAGEEITMPCGEDLGRISRIDMSGFDPRLAKVRVEALCDVDNPLLGEQGAARVFAPQKGADAEAVERLESGMQYFVTLLALDLGFKDHQKAGMGAGGGLAAGLAAFLHAELCQGIDKVIEQLDLDEALASADLVITTEGRLDRQTLDHGKAPAGIASHASKAGVPCIAIAGELVPSDIMACNELFSAVFSLTVGPVDRETSMSNADALLEYTAGQVIRCFLAGRKSTRPPKEER